MSDRLPFRSDVGVLGTGGLLGSETVTNAQLKDRISGYDDESGDFSTWVERVSHIQSRQYCTEDEGVVTLGTSTAHQAIEQAGIDPEEVDMLLLCSFTMKELYPGDHVAIGHSINHHLAPVALVGGCAGSTFGMGLAYGQVKAGLARNVVVIGVEHLTPTLDFGDPLTTILFADGAGAAVVGRKESEGEDTGMIDRVVLSHEPSPNIYMQNANVAICGRDLGPHEKATDGFAVERQFLRMSGGPRVLRNAVNVMAETTVKLLGYTMEDLKNDDPGLREILDQVHLIPHQANGRILDGLQDKLGLHEDRLYRTIYHAGNMSAATNMYTLDYAMRSGNLKREAKEDGGGIVTPCGRAIAKGDLVVVVTIGAGYIFGAFGFRA
ncbi:MAG: 3-oxoacyl-ACP synthase III family protein [Planctomycetota bacterium]